MAKYTLTIETNDPIELADITAAIAEEQTSPSDEKLVHSVLERVTVPPGDFDIERLEPNPPKARRGRAATKATSASAVETIGGAQVPAGETPGESTPSTIASPSEVEQLAADVAKAHEPVTAQDCKLALNAAMDRDVPPVVIQQKMIEKFGAGSVMKIAEEQYPALKAFLEGLTK